MAQIALAPSLGRAVSLDGCRRLREDARFAAPGWRGRGRSRCISNVEPSRFRLPNLL